MGKERGPDSQQRQRDVALQARLELELDVQVQAELEPHGLGVGQARQHGRVAKTAPLGELLVVAAAAAAPRVDRGATVGGGVVELISEAHVRHE